LVPHRSAEPTRILAEVCCARTCTSEEGCADTLRVWNIHYNYHRPRTAARKPAPVIPCAPVSPRPDLIHLGAQNEMFHMYRCHAAATSSPHSRSTRRTALQRVPCRSSRPCRRIGISMAFYTLLHFVEITLGHALNRELGARTDVWTGGRCRSRTYDRALWVPALRGRSRLTDGAAMPCMRISKRRARPRNQVMHQEPICWRDLQADYATIYTLFVCPPAWLRLCGPSTRSLTCCGSVDRRGAVHDQN
jgi:hypothetical protein